MQRSARKKEKSHVWHKAALTVLVLLLILAGLIVWRAYYPESEKFKHPMPQLPQMNEATPMKPAAEKPEALKSQAETVVAGKLPQASESSLYKVKKPFVTKPKSVIKKARVPIPEIIPVTLTFKGREWVQIIPIGVSFRPLSEFGGNPYGPKRDPKIVIDKSELPPEIKSNFTEKLRLALSIGPGKFNELAKDEDSGFRWHAIYRGHYFNQMASGKGQLMKHVVYAGPADKLEAAKMYLQEHGDLLLAVIGPLKCFNWSWIVLKPRPSKEEVPPPPLPPQEIPPKEEKPPEIPPTPEPPLLLIPPEKPGIPELPPEAPPTKKALEFDIDIEAYLWGGRYYSAWGSGHSDYVGGRSNLFLTKHPTALGVMREGVSGTFNLGEGISRSGFKYESGWGTIGPIVDLSGNTQSGKPYKYSLTAQMGEQIDRGETADSFYHSKQRTDIFYLNLGAEYEPGGKYLKRVESWFDAKFDINHSKESTWQQWKIPAANDPPNDRTYLGGGTRLYLFNLSNWHLQGGLFAKYDYCLEDSGIGKEIGPFLADYPLRIVKVGIGWRNVQNSKYPDNNGDAIGVFEGDLDLGVLIKMWLRKFETNKTAQTNSGSQ